MITEYVVKDGGIFRRTIDEAAVNVTQQIINAMTTNASVSLRAVAVARYKGADCPMSISATQTHAFATVRLPHLILRAPFTVIENSDAKFVTPNFSSSTDPVLTLSWTPPSGYNLCLIMRIARTASAVYTFENMWLVCHNQNDNALYRLPISNLYEDGRVCTGSRDVNANIGLTAVVDTVLEQFANSEWRNDLWYTPEHTPALFKWQVLNNAEGFKQMPPGSIPDFSTKIAPPVAQYFLLP